MSEREFDPHKAVDHILAIRHACGKAKGERRYLEMFYKSKKAILMKASFETAVNAQEREAESHPEYLELQKGIQEAIEREEVLYLEIEAAKLRCEIWRTEQANNRFLDKVTM